MREDTELPHFHRSMDQQPSRLLAPGARIGVIGGLGEMGRLFTRFFQDHGFQVEVADVGIPKENHDVVTCSDIVVFAVPLHKTVEIIRDLVPYTRSNQLLLDVSSLKAAPVREMLASTASVVGLHPMFGGRISSFRGQTLVACPVRISPEDWADLHDLFSRSGIRVKESDPVEHDRMMSIIQVLFHMTTMLKGRVLRELGVSIEDTIEYTSPSYRLEINLLGRIFAQNGSLYSAIAQMNPFTRDILSHLRDGLDAYERWYREENLDGFIRDFDASARHLGKFCREAYEESSGMLDYAVRSANRWEKSGDKAGSDN